MRALAQEFRATDKFKEKTWSDLRLLPTPVARYGKETRGRDLRELDPDGHTFAATGM